MGLTGEDASHGHGTGTGATGEGDAAAPFPGAHGDFITFMDLYEMDVDSSGEHFRMFQNRPDTAEG